VIGTSEDDVAAQLRADDDDVNAVRLRGRLSADPERRVLPSGDEVVRLRVVVRRPDGGAVDTVDVSLGPAPGAGGRARPGEVGRRALTAVERLEVDQRVEVVGELRRRWWEAGGARRSRLEVRATAVIPVVGEKPVDDRGAGA
jgi:single-strand DNA-binding protein